MSAAGAFRDAVPSGDVIPFPRAGESPFMVNGVPVMLGIDEAAEKVHMSRHFVRELCLRGDVVSVRAGSSGRGKIFVNLASLVGYLNGARGC